jgi:hypothetical protein
MSDHVAVLASVITLILSVLGHGAFTIWSAATFRATIVAKMDGLAKSFSSMEKELEKRDAQISAAWKRIDDHGERIVRVETKCGMTTH